MTYQVLLAPSVEKFLRKLPPQIQKQLEPVIDALADEPRPSGVVKLKGKRDLYRVRSGDYRIVYEIEDGALLVLVVKVGDRREIYR